MKKLKLKIHVGEIGGMLIILLSVLALTATGASGQTFSTVYQFTGLGDGGNPQGALAIDSLGNLFGTARTGGANFGTVFELPAKGKGATVLYAFGGGTDGAFPAAGLIFDTTGNLYGTTFNGGGSSNCVDGCGTAFKMTKNTNGTFTESVIYAFAGGTSDGENPTDGVILEYANFPNDISVFGTTATGGANGLGTVFEVTPTGATMLVHSFASNEGANIRAGLTGDASDGNLYGVAHNDGPYDGGAAFELSQDSTGTWNETTLYAFNFFTGESQGGYAPSAALANPGGGIPGSLYGTTNSGGTGTCDCGTVFQLTNTNGTWTETVLYSFLGGTDGADPLGSVIADAAGNLYGTTQNGGGSSNCSGGCGTVFKLTKNADGTYTESVLHAFSGSDGESPAAGLVADASGTLYGTTFDGGTHDSGTVFKVRGAIKTKKAGH